MDGIKLAQLKPSLGRWSFCSQWYIRLEVSLSGLRNGHTRLTNGHLMAHEATPVYGRCQVRHSAFHVLVKCPTYFVPCNRFFPSLTSVPPNQRLSLLYCMFFSDFCIFESVRPYL